MNILLLGSGGREHAFAWKLTQSQNCTELYIAPGNAGTAQQGINVALNPNDFEAVKDFVLQHHIEMVVVGPEAPLVNGIFDFFKKENELKDIIVVGPSKEGATLEGSKAFAKEFMAEFGIPTAAYQEFTQDTLAEGINYIASQIPPIVLKADGLAAGKGVLIIDDIAAAQDALKEMLGGKFGAASETVVIEQFLKGLEFSVFVATDGDSYKILPVAKDYKRIGEGDTGLNTGGMGAVSPVPFVDEVMMQKVEERIVIPTINGIKSRGFTYHGFIFLGLIEVNGEPYVIEYNCRMGDPETEVVFPRLASDLVDLCVAIGSKGIAKYKLEIEKRAATTVFLVSGGYPEQYEKGKEILNLDKITDSIVFHAGTKEENDKILTNGGRVLAITSYGADFKEALAISKKNAQVIDFDKKYYRTDIGFDL